MATSTTLVAPRTQWLNTVEFPFEPRTFHSADGAMHYVDEGHGKPIVFVHGSPTWSFLFRKLITGLSARYRCIAVDHLGLGLSDKPKRADYRPAAHTARLEAFIDSLNLRDVTVVGHDFGGSIALDWAARNPLRARDIVLMNTWVWSLAHNPVIRFVCNTASNPMNQYWFRLINPSPKFYLPVLFADNHRLSKWVQDQYQGAFNNQYETYCPEAFARAMTSPDGWYDSVIERLTEVREKPCLILWGDADVTYGIDAFDRLHQLLPNAATVRLAGIGNYVPEEAPEQCVRHIAGFLA
jgi:pimeloyl-ACP methyl ester carboxylesterase